MKISLSQVRFLLIVDDAGSISEAARRLGMTQSGLSQGLITLERALGAALLARSRDGVALTALGHSVIAEARIICNAIERIEAQAELTRSGIKTDLRIASVPSVAKSLLPGWRRTFQRLYPETNISILEGHHIEVGDWVHRGIADLGFAALAPCDLAAEHIRDEPLFVVARRGHRALGDDVVSMVTLARETLITGGFGCEPVFSSLFRQAGLQLPNIVQAQDVGTALEIARQGFGVCLLPDTALGGGDMLDLRLRPMLGPVHRRLYLLARVGDIAANPASRLLKIIRGQEQPPIGVHQ
jgi:DNA-binding transcriptional LysR family regulator